MLLRLATKWVAGGLAVCLYWGGQGAVHAQKSVALPPIQPTESPYQEGRLPPASGRTLPVLPASEAARPPVRLPTAPLPAPSPSAKSPPRKVDLAPEATTALPVFTSALAPSPLASTPVAPTPPAVTTLPPTAPAASTGPAPSDCSVCDPKKCDSNRGWASVPPITPLPRPGFFSLFPTGPGYYSAADQLHGTCRQGPPKYPYPRFGIFMNSFFDMDWRYLDSPDNKEHDTFDFLKRQRFGDDQFMLTTGGEFRARYNFEENTRLLNTGPLKRRGEDNSYDLFRVRLYADLWWTDSVRLYTEFLSATSPDYLLQPLPIDRDPADLLNLFVDLRTFEIHDKPVWVRFGRQELLYGSQRLISPLDWANTRRTFQGVKAFWHSEKFDLDAFCVQPVIPDRYKFDSVDNNVLFAGLWGTYRPTKGQAIDGYYLLLDVTNAIYEGEGGVKGGATINTVGARYVGDSNNWLWDVEGMLQFGGVSNQGLFARACSAGAGYHFKECAWTPVVWCYYDYASGDPDPGTGNVSRTFHQLFPFGHYYFGFIDVIGRRNMNDFSCYATAYPTKWLTTGVQMHNFYLDSSRDALYNAAGLPARRDATGAAGSTVGQQFDLLFNFHLSQHADLLFTYSYLIAGRFIRDTATTAGGRDNPQAFYAQYSYRW